MSAAAVFASCSTLIPHNTQHLIEVFVPKRLHNEVLLRVAKPAAKTARKIKVSNPVSQCANSSFLHLVPIRTN